MPEGSGAEAQAARADSIEPVRRLAPDRSKKGSFPRSLALRLGIPLGGRGEWSLQNASRGYWASEFDLVGLRIVDRRELLPQWFESGQDLQQGSFVCRLDYECSLLPFREAGERPGSTRTPAGPPLRRPAPRVPTHQFGLDANRISMKVGIWGRMVHLSLRKS